MSANISPAKRAHEVLGTLASDFKDTQLAIDCGAAGCPRNRRYRMVELVGVWGDLPLRRLIDRMRCTKCGGAVIEATLITSVGYRRPQEIRIPLLGPDTR